MFPSGRWVCVCQQEQISDVERDLELTFENHQIIGGGRDGDGTFTYRGSYTREGKVCLYKHYETGHVAGLTFVYDGRYDGEGVIYGVWWQKNCPHNCGPFEMRRYDRGDAASVRITRRLDIPQPPASEALKSLIDGKILLGTQGPPAAVTRKS